MTVLISTNDALNQFIKTKNMKPYVTIYSTADGQEIIALCDAKCPKPLREKFQDLIPSETPHNTPPQS